MSPAWESWPKEAAEKDPRTLRGNLHALKGSQSRAILCSFPILLLIYNIKDNSIQAEKKCGAQREGLGRGPDE